KFATKENSLFVVSSHLIELAEPLKKTKQIDYRFFEAEENEGRLRFDYKLHQGVSKQRLGIRVLKEEGIFELLDKV
ncbi:MAG: DNA mismatch repair protein MutS, partial [Candidatus Azotimanducaceae bacterium]